MCQHGAAVASRSAAFGLVLLAMLSAPASAQLTEMRPGARVRLGAPGLLAGRLTGTVLERSTDSLIFATPNGTPTRLPLSALDRVEVSRGRSRTRGALKGATWGAGIGLGLGLISVAAANECSSLDSSCPTDSEFVTSTTVGSTVIGAIIGAIVGSERWQELRRPMRGVLRPRLDRSHVGLAIAF